MFEYTGSSAMFSEECVEVEAMSEQVMIDLEEDFCQHKSAFAITDNINKLCVGYLVSDLIFE